MKIHQSDENPRDMVVRMHAPDWERAADMGPRVRLSIPTGYMLVELKLARRVGKGSRVSVTVKVRHVDHEARWLTPAELRTVFAHLEARGD